MTIPLDLEPAVRHILAALPVGETLTTNALVQRLSGDTAEHKVISRHLMRLADNAPGLCSRHAEVATRGYLTGKMVRRCIWHRLGNPDMPKGVQLAHMRKGDTMMQRPHESSGAASPGTSLADAVASMGQRLQALEDWRARCLIRVDTCKP